MTENETEIYEKARDLAGPGFSKFAILNGSLPYMPYNGPRVMAFNPEDDKFLHIAFPTSPSSSPLVQEFDRDEAALWAGDKLTLLTD